MLVVFRSGKQRSAVNGDSVKEATVRFRDGLAGVAPAAKERGVVILIEALAPHLSNVVTSLDEAVGLVKQIGSPAVQTMFDTHNAVKEALPHGALIKKHVYWLLRFQTCFTGSEGSVLSSLDLVRSFRFHGRIGTYRCRLGPAVATMGVGTQLAAAGT